MLKIDKTQAEYKFGERAVVFKDGDRVGVIRIMNRDASAKRRGRPISKSAPLSLSLLTD